MYCTGSFLWLGKKLWIPPLPPALPYPTLEFCFKQDTNYQDELVIILTKLSSIQLHVLRIHLMKMNLINWCIQIVWSYVHM